MPTQLPRRTLLAALLLAPVFALAPVSALAASKEGGEFFVKLTTIVVEFWDANGIFHVVNMDLTVVFPAQAAINKKITEKIAANLSAMPWEEFAKGNPAATVKAVALDTLRKDPTTDKATEVLVGKLLLR
ncbi:MAG: hypothetical protein H7Z12_08525 [Rhodospirillaceae bacterium]|nr:hypothetical protein [Rhodospirillales bacterium]